MSKDPILALLPGSTHPFAYVDGSPALYVDPLGLFGFKDIGNAVKSVANTAADVGKAVVTAPAKCAKDRTCTQVVGVTAIVAGTATGNIGLATFGAAVLTIDSATGCASNPNVVDCVGAVAGAGGLAAGAAAAGGAQASMRGLALVATQANQVGMSTRIASLTASEVAFLQMTTRGTNLCLKYCDDASNFLSGILTGAGMLNLLNLPEGGDGFSIQGIGK
jgi:hypothetical protein